MDGFGTQSLQQKDKRKMYTKNQLGASKKEAGDKYQTMQGNDGDSQSSMQQKNMTRLEKHHTTQIGTKRITDYESKFEDSRKKLHKAYKREKESKQNKRIQVIDFQKPEKQQQGSKGRVKGKPSLRQKLMTMSTRKSKKKFPPYEMLSSCN